MPPAVRGAPGAPPFFTAVLQALQFEDSDTRGLQNLGEAGWHELLEFCDLAHLTLPLVRKCVGATPGWVVARTQRNLADNELRVRQIEDAYNEISLAFAAAGIKHLVVKGFSRYPDFVEVLEDRMQSDIDLYCPQEFIEAARVVLMGLGYEGDRTLEEYPADHLPEMTRRREWTWRGNMYDPEMPPAVDVHFCFWNSSATFLAIQGVNEFWERRIERRHRSLSFPALCSIDNLAFSALHILRDLQRGDWVLHDVYELAWFLHMRADDQEFWASWRANHDNSLRSLQMVSFWLARDWFHCRWAEAIGLEMATMPLPVRRWLERFSMAPLTGMFHPNKHGIWLHLALLESRRDKLLVLWGTLLPFRLPVVGAPGQDASKTRRRRRFWPSQRYAKYLLHIAFRAAFHLKTSIDTLWQGLGWWIDRWRLSKAF